MCVIFGKKFVVKKMYCVIIKERFVTLETNYRAVVGK